MSQEALESDVAIVGISQTASIRLKQLTPNLQACILGKSFAIGAHGISRYLVELTQELFLPVHQKESISYLLGIYVVGWDNILEIYTDFAAGKVQATCIHGKVTIPYKISVWKSSKGRDGHHCDSL